MPAGARRVDNNDGSNRVLRFVRLACVPIVSFACVSSANAETMRLTGRWQQTVSNAGQCDTCQITVQREGPILRVTSNNGWFAVIDDGKTKNSLSGVGHWKPGYGGPYGGKPFSISFTLTSGQLYMHMAVPADNGAAHLIKAIFEKLPVEDPAPSNDKIKA